MSIYIKIPPVFPLFAASTKFPRLRRRSLWSTARRTRSSTSPTAWRCMSAASAPWSRCGWRVPDTTMWSSTDSTWRGSNSLSHTSWRTCRGVGGKLHDGGGRGKNFFCWLFFFLHTSLFFLQPWGSSGFFFFCLLSEYQFHEHFTLLIEAWSTSPHLPGPLGDHTFHVLQLWTWGVHTLLFCRFSFSFFQKKKIMMKIAHSVHSKKCENGRIP